MSREFLEKEVALETCGRPLERPLGAALRAAGERPLCVGKVRRPERLVGVSERSRPDSGRASLKINVAVFQWPTHPTENA